MAISDSHAMHRMPHASSATSSASRSSPGNKTAPADKGAIRTDRGRRSTPEDKKWHEQHSWHPSNADATLGSTLSRSMRYADPWLRCTGAGGGGGKYGTVRCHSSSYSCGDSNGQRRAGTVRVRTSLSARGGARPTVLPPSANVGDPYDLVRRSRLGRSVSPDTTGRPRGIFSGGYTSAYATVGRRSILECEVNPYDLMDNQSDEQASITCVNGQRIRVRPSLSNANYEDVKPIANTTANKQKRPLDSNYSRPPLNNRINFAINNVDSINVIGSTNTGTTVTTFKSILKKKSPLTCEENEPTILASRRLEDSSTTSTMSSKARKTSRTHLINTDNSASGNAINSRKSGKNNTQFYIPTPSNGTDNSPRKKVQFLMSPEKGSILDDEYQNIIELEQEFYSSHGKVNSSSTSKSLVQVSTTLTTSAASAIPPTQFRLQRSISERLNTQFVAQKVVFHDSMALRSRGTAAKHPDTRTLFSVNSADLERLDGVSKTGKNKQPPCKRPDVPPPEPPNANATEVHTAAEASATTSPVVPPRKRSNNKAPSINLDNIIKISHRIQIRNEEPLDGAGGGSTAAVSNVSVVGVSPVADLPLSPLTTSILIGPDDHCYSTVNLNGEDCYPHYRSSVVVGESAGISNGANYSSSKVYISNNATSCEDTPGEHDAYEDVNGSLSKIDSSGSTSTIEAVDKQHKYEDVVYTDAITEPQELSYEVLQSLLCDPVEAVRRNLVPHVCGKDIEINDSICNARRTNIKCKITSASANLERKSQQILEYKQDLPTKEPIDVDANLYADGAYEALNGSTTSSEPSDCYSNRSSVTEDELHARNNKFYELLADASLAEVSSDLDLELDLELAYSATKSAPTLNADQHHYESILLTSQAKLSAELNSDPIYEDIDIQGGASLSAPPPPLPRLPPPAQLIDDLHVGVEYTTRSIFEGASKYDILSYLVDAKERGCVNETEDASEQQQDPYNGEGVAIIVTPSNNASTDQDNTDISSTVQPLDSLASSTSTNLSTSRSAEIERNDSGVGSETSKCSLSKYRNGSTDSQTKVSQCCEDCDNEQTSNENENIAEDASHFVLNADGTTLDDALQPLVCSRCAKRRIERREIIMEIVETEEKYMRDLQIILEEFYHPMMIAGLLTPDQLQAIFLNIEELLDNSTLLSDRLRDTVDMAVEQGDEDLLQVDIGRLFLDAGVQMLHAFELYCVRQGGAALLLAGLEKEKELLRVFLRVSQMENVVLRRMNLSSFLMVPVQRVTKYPLLLARLFKVTPLHQEDGRSRLHEAQHTIELHLNHINSQTHNIPTKLWRRLNSTPSNSSISAQSNKQLTANTAAVELVDLVGIKLRKIAVDVLDWNHEEATFVLEGRLLVTQPQVEGHHQWRKGRTIKLSPVCAMLVTCGGRNGNYSSSSSSSKRTQHRKGSGYASYGSGFGKLMTLGQKLNGQADKEKEEQLVFPARQKGSSAAGNAAGSSAGKSVVREAALLLLRDKGGRHSLLREPLYLDRCVVAADPAWQSYFEVQELHHSISSSSTAAAVGNSAGGAGAPNYGNATYIFRAEDDEQTRTWYKQLQYYAQGMGAWRRRRNALPNIMIAGLGLR